MLSAKTASGSCDSLHYSANSLPGEMPVSERVLPFLNKIHPHLMWLSLSLAKLYSERRDQM